MEKYNKIELDDMINIDSSSFHEKFDSALEQAEETWIYNNGTFIRMEDNPGPCRFDVENETGFCIKKSADNGILCFFSLSKDSDGKLKEYADHVERLCFVENKNIYYMKSENNGIAGSLYCNDHCINEGVYETLGIWGGTLYYVINDNSIVAYDGKNNYRVADDVGYYGVLPDNSMLVLHDYNEDLHRGILSCYKGKDRLERIDDDVTYFVDATEICADY